MTSQKSKHSKRRKKSAMSTNPKSINRLIYPPKIVDGFTIIKDEKHVLTVSKDDVSIKAYQRYDLLNAFQSLWDNIKAKAFEEYKYKNDLSYEENEGCFNVDFINRTLSISKYQAIYLKIYPKPNDKHKLATWHSAYVNYIEQLRLKAFPLDDDYFENFLEQAKGIVHKFCANFYQSASQFRYAWKVLAEFVGFQNKYYMDSEYHYPLPDQPLLIKENTLSIDENWVENGKQFNRIVKAVKQYWSIADKGNNRTPTFDADQTLTWLIFSSITFGGINDKALLVALVNELLNKPVFIALKNNHIAISVRLQTKNYGNERVESNTGRKNILFNTHQVCLDVISQCWLYRYNQFNISYSVKTEKEIVGLLKYHLSEVLRVPKSQIPSLAWLLKFASYRWELMPGVFVDQALAQVAQGRQRTTGLLANDFYDLITSAFTIKNTVKSHIPLSKISKKVDKYKPPTEVRRKDIVKQLQKELDDNYNSRNFNELLSANEYDINHILKKMVKTKRDITEKILIRFVLDRCNAKPRPKKETIQSYLSSVAYEWLYFLSSESIEAHQVEDFEEVYEEILEHKSVSRNNKDIQYSAKLLQRLHNTGVEHYSLPKVTLKDAQSQRVVRAEWIPPQAYQAILIHLPLVVDSLELDMYKLMFILAYRTGMRKKELLGLRFGDIEGFAIGEPSVIIRPNVYRKPKTQGSIRRVALYGLLTHAELTFFNQYIQLNENNKIYYIFSPSYDKYPIDDSEPLAVLRRLMSLFDAKEYTFHAFRHTAITNLALVLNADESLATMLTGYSAGHIEQVKTGLLGNKHSAQDKWYAIAGLVGHISPNRSFEYYVHSAMLIATYAIASTTMKLDYTIFKHITGISRDRLKSNSIAVTNHKISVSDTRKLAKKLTLNQSRDINIHHPIFKASEFDENKVFEMNVADDRVYRYGIKQLIKFLELLEESKDINVASCYSFIQIDDAKIFSERARQIAHIRTIQNKYRFVDDTKQRVPKAINNRESKALLPDLVKGLWHIRENSYKDYEWFLQTISQKTTNNNAYISFPKINKEDFHKFLMIALQLLPAKSWMVVGDNAAKGILNSLIGLNPEIASCIYKSDQNKAIKFGICVENIQVNNGKSFTGILRFIAHIFLIIDDDINL